MRKILGLTLVAAALLAPSQKATALETNDLLALVAMPLAVAAVSEVTDVPMNELMDVVTLLNDAAVPPAQFVEVVRYVPVALESDSDQQDFIEYVHLREDEGLRDVAMVSSIEQWLRNDGITGVDFDVVRPNIIEVVEDREVYVAPVLRQRTVRTAAAQVPAVQPSHPHGGPPGQLKKIARVQTGAEIVHANRDRKNEQKAERKADRKPERRQETFAAPQPRNEDRKEKARASDGKGGNGKAKGNGQANKSGGNGNGKGNGKGEG